MENPIFKTNKADYVRKYDYLRSFYQPVDEWFKDAKQIDEYLHELITKAVAGGDVDLDDSEEGVGSENEVDFYEYLRERLEDRPEDITEDPKIYEGRLIDQKAKAFIRSQFPNHQVIDFDVLGLDVQQGFNKTKALINHPGDFVLFQPVFLATVEVEGVKVKALAKPDAFIRTNGVYHLIEVKGTSSTKYIHWFDLVYQSNVINAFLNTIDQSVGHYQLCIIKYERCIKGDVTFVLNDWCSLTKTAKQIITKDKKKIEHYSSQSDVAIRLKADVREFKGNYLVEDASIDDVLIRGIYPTFKTKGDQDIKKLDLICNTENFWKRIKQIYEYIPTTNAPCFAPCLEYKSPLKNNDYWLSIRDYYYFVNKPEWYIFKFSGNLYKYNLAVESYQKGIIIHNFAELQANRLKIEDKPNKRMDKYISAISKGKYHNSSPEGVFTLSTHYENYQDTCYFNRHQVQKLFNKLKPKKVYFDFESINLATRVFDNTPPFLQTVNQVSVVLDHGDKNLITKPYLVIDPSYGSNGRGFGINDLKKIVDAILPFPNDLALCQQYSYVVYNEDFEKTRLKEMKYYINDPAYSAKIDVILNNVYDLADLFTIQGESPKKNNTNQAFIFPELYGFYSIKKVLPLVQKYDLATFKATGCKNYKTELEQIHNGSEAQTYSSKRFFNLVSSDEWDEIVKHLGVYCNNDVLAMVAIEWFVDKILKKEIDFKSSFSDR